MRRKITGWILVLTMLTGVLCSCGVGTVKTEKIRDMDFTVLESKSRESLNLPIRRMDICTLPEGMACRRQVATAYRWMICI